MAIIFRLVQHGDRELGELRIELKPEQAGQFSGDGPFCLRLQDGNIQLNAFVPDGVEPFAVSSSVEHDRGGTIIAFRLEPSQVMMLKSKIPWLVPDNLSVSRNGRLQHDFQMRAMSVESDDGEHFCLFVAPPTVCDDLDNGDDSPFEPVVEGGVWHDDGRTCYLDQQLNFHFDPPEPPYLVLRGKKIVGQQDMAVWELENEAAKDTFTVWSEDRNRRMIVESN